jgi:hypothetical protein
MTRRQLWEIRARDRFFTEDMGVTWGGGGMGSQNKGLPGVWIQMMLYLQVAHWSTC